MTIHVKVTKLERLPNRPNGEFIGVNEGGEITEGYWIRGHAFELPKVGSRFEVDRYERNDVKIVGQFSTSPVQAVEVESPSVTVIQTENSRYRVDYL